MLSYSLQPHHQLAWQRHRASLPASSTSSSASSAATVSASSVALHCSPAAATTSCLSLPLLQCWSDMILLSSISSIAGLSLLTSRPMCSQCIHDQLHSSIDSCPLSSAPVFAALSATAPLDLCYLPASATSFPMTSSVLPSALLLEWS